MHEIYKPSEDSFLMSKILKQQLLGLLEENINLRFLEIGAGSGIHLQTAFESRVKKENIFSCDIDKKAVEYCNLLGFQCIYFNLFENISEKYNLIIFNPPYLPKDKRESKDSQIQTTGGKKGDEIINKFLKYAKNHLEPDGKIFLITSSLSPEINFKELGYKEKEIGGRRLFFEELKVWELII